MKNIIQSICEAYSMQPYSLYVGQNLNKKIITKIVEEDVFINGDPYPYYVGYDKDENRLFEFRKDSVNVIFQ